MSSEAAAPPPVMVKVPPTPSPPITASSAAVGTPLLQLDAVFQSPDPPIQLVVAMTPPPRFSTRRHNHCAMSSG